jgi:hypothetical protein
MAEAEDEGDQEVNALVGGEEKQAGEDAHDDHERRRDEGLAPVGPRDLVGFLPNFLQKLKRIGQRLESCAGTHAADGS